MTRAEWLTKIVRDSERKLEVPAGYGWYGAWRHVSNGFVSVKLMPGGAWAVRRGTETISRHDSRAYAIRKASKL